MKLLYKDKLVKFTTPQIIGILNITPDSFSDGGDFQSLDSALKHAERMIEEGADIIDVGGESTRPGAKPITLEDEKRRVLPIIYQIKKRFDIMVSVDTYKAEIARRAIYETGVDIINDISALRFSKDMVDIIAESGVLVILMHMKGTPKNMQVNPYYDDVINEITSFFKTRIKFARQKGIDKRRIIIDPGIGFGKRFLDNIKIIKELNSFTELGVPILLGLSRKSFIKEITMEENAKQREIETVTGNIISIINGASIIRVHDVKGAKKSIMMLKTLYTQ